MHWLTASYDPVCLPLSCSAASTPGADSGQLAVQSMAMEFAARPKMACNNSSAQEVFIWVLALPAYEDSQLASMFKVMPRSQHLLPVCQSPHVACSACVCGTPPPHNCLRQGQGISGMPCAESLRCGLPCASAMADQVGTRHQACWATPAHVPGMHGALLRAASMCIWVPGCRPQQGACEHLVDVLLRLLQLPATRFG